MRTKRLRAGTYPDPIAQRQISTTSIRPPAICDKKTMLLVPLLIISFCINLRLALAFSPFSPTSTTNHLSPIKLHVLQSTQQPPESRPSKKKKKPKFESMQDLLNAVETNPNKFLANHAGEKKTSAKGASGNGTKKKYHRTRKRVERPKQRYLYAAQRRARESEPSVVMESGDDGSTNANLQQMQQPMQGNPMQEQQLKQMEFARSLGLSNPSSQMADAIVGDSEEEVPRIMASIRVDDAYQGDGSTTMTSNSLAYIVYKPCGWSILGGERKKNKSKDLNDVESNDNESGDNFIPVLSTTKKPGKSPSTSSKGNQRKVKAYDEDTDSFYYVEYSESDILAVLTPEEREELLKEGGLNLADGKAEEAKSALARAGKQQNMDFGWDEEDDYYEEEEDSTISSEASPDNVSTATVQRLKASMEPTSNIRPSLVSWLKDLKASEGIPIKGGKNWVALAGAVDVDDTGLVLLCPRDKIDALHVDRVGYVAVLGNGGKLASRSKLMKSIKTSSASSALSSCDMSTAKVEMRARLRKGRDQVKDPDHILVVGATFPDGASTCNHATLLCQDRLGEGVRGDPMGDPLDRRAARRLVHCESMAVTSLVCLDDEPVVVPQIFEEDDSDHDDNCDGVGDDSTNGAPLPDDIAIFANRRYGSQFIKGSFLGRHEGLARNRMTNAYREINGAADGYPGWIVDRYDKWLFVQHEEDAMSARGPLPSLHDGYTKGVYYLSTKADRSIMGTKDQSKPELLEGQAAPEILPIMENGITYLVNLGESFSTGIFLDQRLQRAWLAEHCTENTRVLNCFAHTGAFSIAAATAGASTVSLDLDKKWLDRIRPQMEANGVNWDGNHDCIYGDCFDWLSRLVKRNEQFDIVILDPPSTSVGKKKKRWSVKSDMAELVALAAPLVKSGGLLWTSTNAASLRPEKFAKMCNRGLVDAGISNAKLERVAPMPSDFPSVGAHPVTNLSWRIP